MAAYTTIDDPEAYIQIKAYSGTGSSLALTFDGETDMQPNMVWLKGRSDAGNHFLYDSVRGANRGLVPNDTDDEDTSGESTSYLTSFDSDGITLGGSYDNTNASGRTYVTWCWKETADAGLDIVTFTGTGSANNVSHSLSAVPTMFIVKRRDAAGSWQVYHESLGNTKFLVLNQTGGEQTASSRWNDTSPTSLVFTVNTDADVNASSGTYVTYCFAAKQGFSKFGSYKGNSNANGTFIYTGFRPAYVMVKRTDDVSDYQIQDSKRIGYNVNNYRLNANTSLVETTSGVMDFVSNGFKFRGTPMNTTGGTFIYMAFAEAPFVNSNGVPCNAR